MDEAITIVLPLPPRVLNPNGRHGHWTSIASARKRCRRLAYLAVLEKDIRTSPWQLVVEQATFYHAQRRRRDPGNFIAMMKGYRDGVVDSGLVVDDDADHWHITSPCFEIDKENPRVELAITRKK